VEQYKWTDEYAALNSWISAVENLGVLVFQTGGIVTYSVSPSEARGFSIARRPYPVIVVNGKDSVRARAFTLIHELAHLLLADGGVCDLHDSGVEAFCNSVAAHVLVPHKSLLQELPKLSQVTWTEQDLGTLADRFMVSREVMLIRLVAVGRASQEQYKRWKIKSSKVKKEKFLGRLTSPQRAIKRYGRLLPRLAFEARDRGLLATSELADILGIKIEYLPKVENAVFDPRYQR
jgi:Zn-dependent peptidase ImmA (M78 family)